MSKRSGRHWKIAGSNRAVAPYRFLEGITRADIAFRARGRTLADLFASAGRAVSRTMVNDLHAIRLAEARAVDLSAPQVDLLLFNFLQEIIYYKDADQLLFGKYEIKKIGKSPPHLSAILFGERIDPKRHALGVDVKAVTMHRFEVSKDKTGWRATVVLDI